jgi:hypothetical protein
MYNAELEKELKELWKDVFIAAIKRGSSIDARMKADCAVSYYKNASAGNLFNVSKR